MSKIISKIKTNNVDYGVRAGYMYYGTTTGTDTALTVNILDDDGNTISIPELVRGMSFILSLHVIPKANATLSVNGLTAKPIQYGNGLTGNNWVVGEVYHFIYNSTAYVAVSTYDDYVVTTTGSGDVITSITKTGKTITATKGNITGGEINQNAFSNVKIGDTTIDADSKTDTLTLVAGNNITLTPDATNNKITITGSFTHNNSKNIIGGINSTNNESASNGNVYIHHFENDERTSRHSIVGGGGTTVKCDSNGNITISSPTATSGTQGYQGFQGYQGYRGYQGYQGDRGYQGYQGYTGQWYSGTEPQLTNTNVQNQEISFSSPVPSAFLYAGDCYINSSNGNVYTCVYTGVSNYPQNSQHLSKWSYLCNIKGPAGSGGSGTDYYHNPVYTSGLTIGRGMGVNNLFVPYATASEYGVSKVYGTTSETPSGNYNNIGEVLINESNGKLVAKTSGIGVIKQSKQMSLEKGLASMVIGEEDSIIITTEYSENTINIEDIIQNKSTHLYIVNTNTKSDQLIINFNYKAEFIGGNIVRNIEGYAPTVGVTVHYLNDTNQIVLEPTCGAIMLK